MFTIPSILDRAATLFPDAHVTDGDRPTTYPTLRENAARLAGTLADDGVDAGDTVAIADWNTPRFLELLYAVTGRGAIAYPVNLNLPGEQIGYTLEASETDRLLYADDFAPIADAFPGETGHVDDLDYGAATPLAVEEDRDAVTLFTSGTTGRPKPVRYTHERFVHGGLSIAHQLAEYDTPATLSGEDTIFPGIPMFHLLSWGSAIIAPYLGANLSLGGQFDPAALGAAVEAGEATWTNLVPTMVRHLLATEADVAGLKVLTGGSAIDRDLAETMADSEVAFSSIYGGTDMLAAAISIETDHAREASIDYLRRVVHPVPFGEFRLEHREGMDEEMGELHFRAPWLPDGYYGMPERSAEAFLDGWFATGDVGRRMPDGGIRILDRLGDTIKSGGEWIPPSVVESAIVEFPGVASAAVFARPDEEWGERPVAAITPDDVDVDALRDHLASVAEAGEIASWWIPDAFYLREELPLTSTGKMQKTQLREELLE
ncbi:MAG: AMP-binding protein [Halanaeroarchaeum sp.]